MRTSLRRSLLPTGLAVVFSTGAAAQTVRYEFREFPEDPPIATFEFASPPASANSPWSTTSPADLLSLTADDARFGLGQGNVVDQISGYFSFSVESDSGAELDGGGMTDDAASLIDLFFNDTNRGDIFESFANAAFVSGDWTAAASTGETDITLTPLDSVVIDETDVTSGAFTLLQLVGFESEDATGCGPVSEPAACGTEYLSLLDPLVVIFPVDHEGNVTFWDTGLVIPSTISVGTNIDLFGDGSWYFTNRDDDPYSADDFQPHAIIRVPEPSTLLSQLSMLLALCAMARARAWRDDCHSRNTR
ncbi:MAG: hypothetical protein JRE71_20935 [Deltaproteobacteria bacterium]|nr:hypothetical protein [Deltaproteobacteria bacterium]